MGIHDIEQPARSWLADHFNNFQTLIDNGEDPSVIITMNGVEMEIRLNKCPGLFHRETFNISGKRP